MTDLQIVSRNDAALAKASRIVHIKCGIEVEFKEKRTRRPLAIFLGPDESHQDQSAWFSYDEEVTWTVDRRFELPSQMVISVRKKYKLRDDRDIVNITIDLKDLFMKPLHQIDQPDGVKLSIRIRCEAAGEFVDLIRRLIEESQKQMENMKMFLQRLAKVCEALNIFVSIAEPASDINSVVSATVSTVSLLCERCNQFRECYDAASDVMRDIASFLPFTEIPLDHLKSAMTEKTVKEMLVLFEKIVRSILKYSSDRTLGALLAVGERLDEVNSYKEELIRGKEILDWCIKTEVWKVVLSIEQNTDNLVLDKLCPVMDAFYKKSLTCLEGPRRGMVQTIQSWASNTSGPKIFWLRGFAGSGKTAIAHTIAEMLNHENRLAGCFFCARDSTERNDPNRLIPTIAYQLSKWHKVYRSIVVELLNGSGELELRTGLEKQYELLVEKPLQQLAVGVPPRHKPLVIVLDSLDLCCDSEESRRFLSMHIKRIATAVSWLKVFVSGVKLPELEDGLRCDDLQVCDIGDSWNVLRDDISEYTAYLEEIREDAGVRGEYLKYRATSLLSKIHRGLRVVLSSSRSIPDFDQTAGLEIRMFVWTLLRIIFDGEDFDEGTVSLVKDSVAITACISRNRVSSISVLLCFLKLMHPTIEENHFVATLRPLVFEGRAGNLEVLLPPRLFLEFILERYGSRIPWLDVGPLEMKVSGWCLDIMTSQLKFNTCSLESAQMKNEEIFGHDPLVSRNISDPLRYSCLHWMNHIVQSNDAYCVRDRVLEFLSVPTALHWTEVLSLTGSLEDGKAILQKCIECFKGDGEIVQAATAMLTFISDFHDAISISAPHVYISALSWGLQGLTKGMRRQESIEALGCSQSQVDMSDLSMELTKSLRSARCFSSSPDRSKFATGHLDGHLRIRDAVTGKLIRDVKSHDEVIHDITFSPDGNRIATGSDDRTLRIWDAQSGNLVRTLEGHTFWVRAVRYSPDGAKVVSGSWDCTVRIWDALSGAPIGQPLKGHEDFVLAVAFSSDGSRIASGSTDNTVRIWDARSGTQIGEPLKGHDDWIQSVAFSPDNSRIVSGSNDSTVRVWDARTGASVGEPMKGHEECLRSVTYTADGSRIISGSDDKTMRVWDAVSLDPIGVVPRGESRRDPDGGGFLSYPSWWPDDLPPRTDALIHSDEPAQIPEDGWLRTLDGGLFLWIPHRYREDICCRGPTGKIPPRMSFDWKKVPHGTDWSRVKEMIEGSNEQ